MERPSSQRIAWPAAVERAGPLAACALAVVAIAAGMACRWALDPLLDQRATFIFFVPAVVLAAALAGLWPGVFASLLGAVAGVASDALSGPVAVGNLIGAAVFVLVGLAVTV